MPPDMRLRSDWEETSLSAPADRGSIDVWSRASGEPREEPIPLQKFLRYSDWFRATFVPDADPNDVVHLDRAAGVLRITTAGGDEVDAARAVIAVGAPPSPTLRHPSTGRWATASGSRSTAATTGLTRAAGSSWSAAARAVWRRRHSPAGPAPRSSWSSAPAFAGSPTASRTRRAARCGGGCTGRPCRRGLRPAAPQPARDPPDLFAALPARARRRVAARILRAGGSPWVRSEIDGHVAVTEGVAVQRLERNGDTVRLALSDGSTREANAVVVSAGFRFSLDGSASSRPPSAPAWPCATGGWSRPLLPRVRPGPDAGWLRRRAPLRADRPLRLRQPLHRIPRPRGLRPLTSRRAGARPSK